ncbi:glycoside hydrolase family 9 protein [Ideonella sp. BN130291]|uniref:glycoside hydrolase family 9 protein n=1 Tax=Ideonella sp. BN130291 TaxID=3112940 RepID=UPI002E263C4C|nr:glycoside hydrolase family 9 protein [Ideonella sp. BN130291]
MKFLHNHVGYALTAPKRALLQCSPGFGGGRFSLVNADTRELLLGAELRPLGGVARWRDWQFWEADFSAVQAPARCFISLDGATPPVVSHTFTLAPRVLDRPLLSDLLHYFKGQRCTGIFDAADHACPIFGSDERVDVHGGWYDASGDVSKYLSHLSYANFLNPQQTPQLVWNLIDGRSRLGAQPLWFDERMVDEALHGADYLLRLQHPSGYFHMTVFDRWSKDVAQRRVCSYTTQQGHMFSTTQAAFRQGGGSTIAALARASQLPRDGEAPREAYLAAAERGFAHLQAHNREYLPDGQENTIDDYCALLAACELVAATGAPAYGDAAEARAARLVARQHEEGWFWADDAATRSYVHAAEAGLPCVALARFLELMPRSAVAPRVRDALVRAWRHQLALAAPGEGNPFGYPRQWVQQPGRAPRAQFFMPHDNDSGYWWQGENARLASIASAALATLPHLQDPALRSGLAALAQQATDWILGFNPFDACMMQGQGHNPPQYEPGYFNAPGGVCNGITACLHDEEDIDFRMPQDTDMSQSWRWSEQWLPHGAWLFLATAHAIGAG